MKVEALVFEGYKFLYKVYLEGSVIIKHDSVNDGQRSFIKLSDPKRDFPVLRFYSESGEDIAVISTSEEFIKNCA